MEVLKIEGGRPLRGTLEVSGSKNASLAILSAVMLSEGPMVLHNVPDITDVRNKLDLLATFGLQWNWHEGSLYIDASTLRPEEPPESLVRPIRTSFYVLGPLLARVGRAVLPAPGGCRIGARPVDYHLKGLALLGASIGLEGGRYVATAPRLHGAEVYFDFPSAGATQHLMATATLAEGITVIHNAAMEPEVVALARFLTAMGARIEGAGTSTITITGVARLNGCEFRIPADRLQAGTYLLAGCLPGSDVTVSGILPEHQLALVNKLGEAGADVTEGADWVRVRYNGRMRGIRIKTMPYPGFATDMQQPLSAMLTLAQGASVVEETIYESRTGHVQELNRMGAQMRVEGRAILIAGVPRLQGAPVEASDLRAGAALVLAGLAADGITTIKNVHFIDRGYENIEENICRLGGSIQRVANGGARSASQRR